MFVKREGKLCHGHNLSFVYDAMYHQHITKRLIFILAVPDCRNRYAHQSGNLDKRFSFRPQFLYVGNVQFDFDFGYVEALEGIEPLPTMTALAAALNHVARWATVNNIAHAVVTGRAGDTASHTPIAIFQQRLQKASVYNFGLS